MNKQKIDIYHLPNPTTPLVGREEELAAIDRVFHDKSTYIVALVAAGGVGKSALTDEWLQRLEEKNYNGAQKVFGWSFYSQGTHETQTSSGLFFEEALPFFGHEDTLSLTDDTARGRRLAELLRQQPCILVLDGVEPLQHRADILGGRFKDVGIYSLLRDVDSHGLPEHSLIIVSSRQPITELESRRDTGYHKIDLQTLNNEDGARLLKALGVKGLSHELQAAVTSYGGHALALVLLGNLLAELYDGDVNQYQQLPLLEDEQEGSHAKRVLRFYDEECWETNAPERVFLQLLGLFDRPMGSAEKNVLLQKAAIAQPLTTLSDIEWRRMLVHLRKLELLSEDKAPSSLLIGGQWKSNYDTHPLIRNYLGKQLQKQQPEAWQQAHQVLFEHFQTIPDKEQPNTLEELEPLYRAVHHGCLAEEYQKSLNLYRQRIARDTKYYSGKQLGAYASNLAAMSDFFSNNWTQFVFPNFSVADQGWLLAEVSSCLMAVGRLEESIESRQASMLLMEKLEDWHNSAIDAENLVDQFLSLGRIEEAKHVAQQAISWTQQMSKELPGIIKQNKLINVSHAVIKTILGESASHCKLAATLYLSGNLADSHSRYQLAEALQARVQPSYHWLYSTWGNQYCSLLLDSAQNEAEREMVLKRGQQLVKWRNRETSLLDIALVHLTLARVFAALKRIEESHAEFDKAVAGIYTANKIEYIPIILLSRANFHRQQRHFSDARQDLDEAWEIIDRCGMRLYAVDALLLQGNLKLDQLKTSKDAHGILAEAEQAYQQAKTLINDMQYGLRIAELSLLVARIDFYKKHVQGAETQGGLDHLEVAKQRIEKIGQWGLMPKWDRVKKELEETPPPIHMFHKKEQEDEVIHESYKEETPMESKALELPFELRQKITKFLTSLPNINDSTSQRAFVYSAGLDTNVQNQLSFGAPVAQFVQVLVTTLSSYSKLKDGRNALEAVLEAAKQYVGQDRRAYSDRLIKELQTISSSSELSTPSMQKPATVTKSDLLNVLYQVYRREPGEWVSSEQIRKELNITQEQLNDFILVLREKGFMEVKFLGQKALLRITTDGVAIMK